jgi:putative membrane protein
MMWPGYGWGYGGFALIMPILGIVVMGLIIWGIVMLARRGSTGCCGTGQSTTESALDILKRRYANGEIGKEEFEEKKRATA